MDLSHRLTLRERLTRIGGGLGLTVAGCVVFTLSQRRDPENRWAALGILGIVLGLTWATQGLRGRRDGPISHDEEVPVGDAISAERTVAGAIAAWLVPGLGHWLIGRRAKAILFFTVVTATFVAGVLLAEGRNLSYERDGIYFLAYLFNAGETLVGWLLTRNLEVTHRIPALQIGFLYTAVACLLNLVAMMDFISSCSRGALPDEGMPPGGQEAQP
jgi:Family of unknown function (DUF6677)